MDKNKILEILSNSEITIGEDDTPYIQLKIRYDLKNHGEDFNAIKKYFWDGIK